jgi:hypothetical protein
MSATRDVFLLLDRLAVSARSDVQWEPAPSPECFKRARQSARTENARLIAAAVIAAIRLNREEIKNSPVVHAKISDSLKLADMIVAKMKNA